MPSTFKGQNNIQKQLEKHLYWAEIRLRHPCDEGGGTTQTNAN